MTTRPALVAAAVFAIACCSIALPARSAPNPANVPIYTSPIDITGLKLQLRVAAPDRDTGKLIDVTLPLALLPTRMSQVFTTPISTQIDQYWNVVPDSKTGMTARAAACDAKGGIKEQVAIQIAKLGPGFRAYDISCNLAQAGQLVAKQIGSTLLIAYLLNANVVKFATTTPGTCHAGSGTPACPNDPRFTVHFATQLATVLRTPSLCRLSAEGGTVYVNAASIDSDNGIAAVAKFFAGQKFLAAEVAMTNVVRNQPLPLDASFAMLRTSDACTGKVPGVTRVLTAFRELDTVIDMRQGLILRARHVGITAPVLDAPNPGALAVAGASTVPSFTRPTISTSQPLVAPGTAIEVTGRYFPPNTNLATALPVTIRHGGYGENSQILGGLCLGGATEVRWAQAGGAPRVLRLPGDARGACAPRYEATKLAPSTAYEFSARDCDPLTCSPWSATIKATTAKADAARSNVALTLDGRVPLNTAVVDAAGTFRATITVPAGTAAGVRTIHAVNGDASADASIQVTPPAGRRRTVGASIQMVGVLKGETGCPNHPITSTQTDDTFMLFGMGFAAGSVTFHLDTTTGPTLGAATVRADGTICQQLRSPSGNAAGAHTLVAVQNGATAAQSTVTFVLPSGVR